MGKNAFDPEVYEFYKAAIDGAGFSAHISAADIEKLRENEITSHAAHLDLYEVYEKHDVIVDRKRGRRVKADPEPEKDSLLLRVYVPEAVTSVKSDGKGLPVLLYFHGGGFIMGSIEDHDPLCGKLADECGAVVIAPEYRLAPEYPFPACIEDAVLTAEWAMENAHLYGGDPRRMLAGGDSSGANIAAVLALLAKEGLTDIDSLTDDEVLAGIDDLKGIEDLSGVIFRNRHSGQQKRIPELSGLILLYGVYGCKPLAEYESAKLYGDGSCVLPLNAIDTMMELYVPEGTDPDDFRLNPGKAADLSGMPPAIVVTAEFDPLRDDGEEFARRLEKAGNSVELIRIDGMMHGFALYWQRFSKATKLLEDIGRISRHRF